MKKLLAAAMLLVFWTVRAAGQDSCVWECREFSPEKVILKGGAKIEDGKLILDGKNAYAEIPESNQIQLTKSGMTLSIVTRLRDNGVKDGRDDAHDMFFCKEKAFLFGRNCKGYYVNFHNGQKYCANLKGGILAAPGEWSHLAAVFEYVNDQAQGDVGFLLSIYVDGEPAVSRKFLWAEPVSRDLPVKLGSGLGGGPWFLHGEIGEAAIYDRALKPGEINELFQKNKYTRKLPKGFTEIKPELAKRFASLKKEYDHPAARWILSALERSAATGYPQSEIEPILNEYEKIASIRDVKELQAPFNRSQEKLHLLVNGEIAALLHVGKGKGAHPVAGLYSLRTHKDIFGERTLSWAVRGTNGPQAITVESNSPEVEWESIMDGDSALKIRWTVSGALKFTVDSRVEFSGPRMESDLKIKGISGLLTEVSYPRYAFAKLNGKHDTMVYPWMSGALVRNPMSKNLECGPQFGRYPSGSVSMQFGAYYDDETGIYFGYEDGLARTKDYEAFSKRQNLNVGWTSPIACKAGEQTNEYSMNGKAVVELYQGEWFEAGEVYRRFLERDAAWWIRELPRKDTPEWYRSNILTINMMSENQAVVEQYRDMTFYLKNYFECPLKLHWYGWDQFHRAGWPHFIPHDFSLAIMKQITSSGNYVVPYIDDRLWKIKDGPDNTDWMYQSHGSKYAIRNRDGSINTEYYSTKGEFAIMCPAAKGWQDVLVNLTERLADYGFSGAYHDQVATARPICCFDTEHGHGLNDPSLWLEEGYWPIFERIHARLRGKHPGFSHSTEDNSEPYLKCFDGFHVWRWNYPGMIPLFQSLYAGRVQFEGLTYNRGKIPGDPQSFFCKVARQTVYSEQLGDFDLNTLSFPDERRLFVKKAAHVRKVLLPCFNEGRMLPPIRYAVPPEMQTSWWGGYEKNPITLPVIESCAWQLPNGSKVYVFANSGEKEERAELADCTGFWICREGAPEPFKSNDPVLLMKPRSFEIRVDGREEDARRIQQVLKRFSSFDHGKSAGMSIRYIPRKITAGPGDLITVRDAAGFMGCAVAKDRSYAGYIQNDALIFFDEADFGIGTNRMAVNVAVSPDLAGGVIEAVITDPNGNETVVGRITLSATGGFHDYQDQTFELDQTLRGKQKIHFHFIGNAICNFRGWKFF